jgi:hypothetical protein
MKVVSMSVSRLFAAMLLSVCALPIAAQGLPSVSRQVFSDADRDGDGTVSLDEFHKDIVRSFHALDFDRDGFISQSEVQSLPNQDFVKRMTRIMRRADKDADGRLSFKEVVEARMSYFDQADTNRDDRLSLEEALNFDKRLEALRIEKREARGAAKPASTVR